MKHPSEGKRRGGMKNENELEGRLATLEAAFVQHVAGTALALKALAVALARQADFDPAGLIWTLDEERAALSKNHPSAAILGAMTEMLRQVTRPRL
jgi:hypothetical protein